MNLKPVNINQLSAKMKSKKELYNFLLQDCQAYLPPMDATNVYFLNSPLRTCSSSPRHPLIVSSTCLMSVTGMVSTESG